jgi:hypothetical protein
VAAVVTVAVVLAKMVGQVAVVLQRQEQELADRVLVVDFKVVMTVAAVAVLVLLVLLVQVRRLVQAELECK